MQFFGFAFVAVLALTGCSNGDAVVASKASAVAADDKYVYVTDDAYRLIAIPHRGGERRVLDDDVGLLRDAAIDGDFVYYIADTGPKGPPEIRRVAKAGAEHSVLTVEQSAITNIAVDATHVYYASTGLRRVPKSGGSAEKLEAMLMAANQRFVVDERFVYAFRHQHDTGLTDLVRMEKATQEIEKLVTDQPGYQFDLLVDGDNLWWIEDVKLSRHLVNAKIGEAPENVNVGPLTFPYDIARDSAGILVSDAIGDKIWRISPGGKATVIARMDAPSELFPSAVGTYVNVRPAGKCAVRRVQP
jgi:hypothetical protein